MDRYIKYFQSILPYSVVAEYVGVVDSLEYFYISSTSEPITQLSHHFVLSKDILIKADVGSQRSSSFIKHIEMFRRWNGSWNLIGKGGPKTLTAFTIDNLRKESHRFIIEFYKGKGNINEFISAQILSDFADDLLTDAFRNQYDNLAKLYINELK